VNLKPWLASQDLERGLVDPVVAAERAGLDVVVPALRVGWATGLDSIPATVAAVVDALPDSLIRETWGDAAQQAQDGSTEHWASETERAGVEVADPGPPRGLTDAWAAENVDRTKDLRDSVAEALTEHMRDAMAGGTGEASTLARDLEDLGLPATNGRLGGRASVIAADQLGNLESGIAKDQQRKAGITSFVWTTQGDSRVRDAHVALSGDVFPWDDPPSEGFPGEPIGCRCFPTGVLKI
jgi:SPP1 gp7 family putative phage head morphogenesis protein